MYSIKSTVYKKCSYTIILEDIASNKAKHYKGKYFVILFRTKNTTNSDHLGGGGVRGGSGGGGEVGKW